MGKMMNIRKSAGTAAVVAVLAGVFGVHAAVQNNTDEVTYAAQAVTVEGRDDAASRGAERTSVMIKSAAMVLTEESMSALAEAPELDHYRVANIGVANGQLNEDDLCKLSWTQKSYIRCDAAAAFEHLNAAFKAQFGHDIEINDSYRSYEKQVWVKETVGANAAVPGYSNHGFGVALDLGSNIPDASSAEYQWMDAHAGDFGWENPEFAKTTKIEPWHWEFVGFGA